MVMSSNIKTKNSMPAFSRGTLEHLYMGIADGRIVPPAFHFLTENNKKCLAYVDIDNTVYQINLDRIEKLEEAFDGLKDDQGNIVPVKEYVQPTIDSVEDIKQNGATVLLTLDEEEGN